MSDDKKIVLNMSEDNEISFGLSIEGYSSDPSLTSSPKVRFSLMEGDEKLGFLLPAKFEQGQVSIKIPSSNVYKEGKSYAGTLEVFLGNRYFKPAEIEIEFHKPLDVKANLVSEAVSEVKNVSPKEIVVKRTPTKPTVQAPVARAENNRPSRPQPKPISEKKIDVLEELTDLLAEEERLTKLLQEKKRAAALQQQKSKTPEQKFKERIKKMFIEEND
jgi:hypothetical protein